jgi:hypothetical protein
VGINKRPIPPKLNSPNGVRATATPSSVSTPSQPFPSSVNANKDPAYPSNINTLSIYFRVEDRLT